MPHRQLLGDFLKERRSRLRPSDVGLPDDGPRRTPGLRRSEVAQLAGISTEWYTFFEKGRERAMTATIVEPIARALRLNAAEREYVDVLARPRVASHANEEPQFPHALEWLFENVNDCAFLAYDRWLTAMRWNACAAAFFSFDSTSGPATNLLMRMFLRPEARALWGDGWEFQARVWLGIFRRNLGFDPANENAQRIITALRDALDFQRLWRRQDVFSADEPAIRASAVSLEHAAYGRFDGFLERFTLSSTSGSQFMVLTPTDEINMRTLRSAGMRRVAAGVAQSQSAIASSRAAALAARVGELHEASRETQSRLDAALMSGTKLIRIARGRIER